MKLCPKCNTLKPRADFYKQSKSADGLQYQCKKCHRVVARKWYQDHSHFYIRKEGTYR